MNVDLLEGVQRAIVRTPNRFCAAQWAFARNAEAVLREGAVPDGFRCCIAGHVLLEGGTHSERDLLRAGGFHTGGELWVEAARHASICSEQGRELFFPSQWDRPFKRQYYLCGREAEAALAADYLDYFLEKYGPDLDRSVGGFGEPERERDRAASVPTSRAQDSAAGSKPAEARLSA